MKIAIQALHPRLGESVSLPHKHSDEAAGFDVCAVEPETLAPGERALVPCGFAMALPPGFEAQVRPRSGLAFKHGVTVLNAPGTIDSDYRGEVKVLLINHGSETFHVDVGMRIAQLVIAQLCPATFEPSDELPTTSRGAGGFGSTGS